MGVGASEILMGAPRPRDSNLIGVGMRLRHKDFETFLWSF